MFRITAVLLAFAGPMLLLGPAAAQNIAPTEALTPAEQQAKFHLPPGFEIQLVVSEPAIGQPMNLNFDVRGRLWISHSVEYPYPANGPGVEPRDARFQGGDGNKPRDRLTVVETSGMDPAATKVTHFAEGLNIPIGLTPLGNGSEAVAYSIPNISHFVDTNGDGHSNRRTPLYTGFGNRDTHGMSNSYTRWIDGWIYGCHGFSNSSLVRDANGRVVPLNSGNTYRFQADGSRFELFTAGQVNPFGMTFDPLGNLYDADCHSMPVYLLLRGARYPHFGSAPDGLGFGPTMINHNHGSTGICGPAYYAATHFPAEYRDNLFICNPVTGRVHRDALKQHGSTYLVDSQEDLIRCDDPWFRPVDAVVGPDGALYVADFYNAIIGHYEVELQHPKRDRTHGRVWRIVYRGEAAEPPALTAPNLTKDSIPELVARLGDANLQVRTLATNYLFDAHGKQCLPAVHAAVETGTPEQRAHGLWLLERLGDLNTETLRSIATDPDRLVRVHAMRMLAERKSWTELEFDLAHKALADADPFVCRVAADAVGQHVQAGNVFPLLVCWNAASAEDTHLIHTIQLALREHMRSEEVVTALLKESFEGPALQRMQRMAAVAESPTASLFLLNSSPVDKIDPAIIQQAAPQIARLGDESQFQRLIEVAEARLAMQPRRQAAVLQALANGLEQKGGQSESSGLVKSWCERLAPSLLESVVQSVSEWTYHALPGQAEGASPWGLRERKSADGATTAMIDSIVNGEQLTGIYRSKPFRIPAKLEFWMCGQDGRPGQKSPSANHLRLRLAASEEIIAQQTPPRNDTAEHFQWDLTAHAKEWGVLEIVDANADTSYAWIGVGRFQPEVVSLPMVDQVQSDTEALALLTRLGPATLAAEFIRLATDLQRAPALRLAAADGAIHWNEQAAVLPVLDSLLLNPSVSLAVRQQAAQRLGSLNTEAARDLLAAAAPQTAAALQREIALALCQSKEGAQQLLLTIIAGKASARLLQDPAVVERFRAEADEPMWQQASELVAALPSLESRLLELIAQYQAGFDSAQSSAERGQEVFKKHCAACHRLEPAETVLIGPQLVGVGRRGVARLLEDVLDPHRNVDAAFRTTSITTAQGKVITGLKLREEGEILVLADSQGKEIRIAREEIEQTRPSPLSLMPSNMADTLKPQELYDLLALLLQK